MKKMLLLALCLMTGSMMNAQTQLTTEQLNTLNTVSNGSVTSIHDPSVVFHNGTYTVWGSHLGCATSNDLITWTNRWEGNNSMFRRLSAYGASTSTACNHADAFSLQRVTKVKNSKGELVDFPNFDAEAYCKRYAPDKNTWINGNMWAPDIIYNTAMKKWCMYLSLNGDNWSSIIILLTADAATGPFTYEGPVVMGGFNGQTYGGVQAPKIGETDYTIATGETTIASRYIRTDTGSYWPNCIDPCVFYDEEGELWMSYGSWSGGIFMLKLDKDTGLRDYTYTYPSDYASAGVNGLSDPYYGKKIAGGGYASGEGSYIQHIGNYYYLFMSYGFFEPDGGYEMRVFRSQNPDGPYVDGSGNKATNGGYIMNYGPNARTNMGMKLMASYNNWGNQNVGECAQGHNSACTDDKGRSFVVYHTKFNDGTKGHQVRVHQLFVNDKGWLVAAPFNWAGGDDTDEKISSSCKWTKEELVGEYHLLTHPYKLDHANYQEMTPTTITLTEDGKVSGSATGTWSVKEGTSHVTIRLDGTYYYGVLCEQEVNGATIQNYKRLQHKAIALTAVSTSGVSVWAYKLDEPSALAQNYQANKDIFTTEVKEGTIYSSNIDLNFVPTDNVVMEWASSNPDIISNTGKYDPTGLTEVTPVTLTGRMTAGNYFWEQTYNIRVAKETIPSGDYMSGLIAYYDFDDIPCYNAYNEDQKTAFMATGTKPSLTEDLNRFGKVLHQNFGAIGSNSATRMTNPVYGAEELEGLTISMWVKRTDNNRFDALWGFFNSTSSTANGARFFLTGNSHLAYNDNAGTWFDINHPDADTNNSNIPVGKWSIVTITIGETNGVAIYVDGLRKAFTTLNADTDIAGSTMNNKAKNLPYEQVLQKLTEMKYFFLGQGSFWGSADCCFDELTIYNRELSGSDVRALRTMLNRVHDFTPNSTGINSVSDDDNASDCRKRGTFDISGRRYEGTPMSHGLYIINGKKVVR